MRKIYPHEIHPIKEPTSRYLKAHLDGSMRILLLLGITWIYIGFASAEAASLTSDMQLSSDITSEFFVTNEGNTFLEGHSGLKLKEGGNLFLYERVRLSVGRRMILNFEIKQSVNKDKTANELFRGYLKIFVHKFSLEIGKDNVNLGPGEYGMLLSNNVEPYPLIKIQTEEALNFLGKWDIVFVRGWLIEERSDVSNPDIFALRFIWKPVNFLEIGVIKTEMFGGDGRPEYSISEYWELLTSSRDNIPGDKYDNDGYAGYDISIYLPLDRWFPSIKSAKLYAQETGTDMYAFWQKEDKGRYYYPFGFQLSEIGYLLGFFFQTKNDAFRLEYADTAPSFYSHSVYHTEGYTYKGLSLGYPYGRNMKSLFLKHRHYFDGSFYTEYKLGGYVSPVRDSAGKMHRYYASLAIDKRIKNFSIGSFIKLDWVTNYDSDPLPTRFEITDEDKTFYIVGLFGNWRF